MTAHRLRLPSPTPAQRRGRSFFITTYCVLFALPTFACYLIIDSIGLNIGDFIGSPVETSQGQALAGLIMFLIVYAGFHRFGQTMLNIPTVTSSPFKRNGLLLAILIGCVAVDLFFYFVFEFGRAGTETATSLSFISVLMPKDVALVLLLQANAHRPKRALLVMAGFTAFGLSLGWTGQFFTLFITSLYLFRDRLRKRKLLVAAIVVAGIAVFPAIFSIKLAVRQGTDFEYDVLSVVNLPARLTGYPALIYVQGERTNLLASYPDYFDNFHYIAEPLLAIVPKSILGLQSNITLEKAIVEYKGGNPELTQFIWGLPTKLWFYWQASPLHFALFCLENGLLFWAAYAWARRRRDEFLVFYLLYQMGSYIWSGDLSTLFVSLIRIPVCFMFYSVLDATFARRRQHAGKSARIAAPKGVTE